MTARCPPAWQPYLGRYRTHNPWRPTFLIAAREGELVLGTDWLESERLPLAPLGDGDLPRRRAGMVAGAVALRHAPRRARPPGDALRHAVLPGVRLLASVPAMGKLIYSAITSLDGFPADGTAIRLGRARRGGARVRQRPGAADGTYLWAPDVRGDGSTGRPPTIRRRPVRGARLRAVCGPRTSRLLATLDGCRPHGRGSNGISTPTRAAAEAGRRSRHRHRGTGSRRTRSMPSWSTSSACS